MTTNALKYGLLVAVAVSIGIATPTKGAERGVRIHIYAKGSDGTYQKVGMEDTTDRRYGDSDWALVCDGPGSCHDFDDNWCQNCHGQSIDRRGYTSASQTRHVTTYFPKFAFPIAEGQRVKLPTMSVTRQRGVLFLEDEYGRRSQLPPNALVIKGKDGRGQFVAYPGATPPVFTPRR